MKYKSNKIVTAVLAILLVLVIGGAAALVGVLSNGFKDWTKFQPDEQTEQTDETADNGGSIIGEGESNGIKMMSVKIATADYAANDISPMEETAYQLTATITPDSATNKTVDWTIAFVNPSSEWATGKTVTNYVTVTPTADGALTANVECLQAFGEQIKVTVTSRDNDGIFADCFVDYAKRIQSAKFTWAEVSVSGYDDTAFSPSVDSITAMAIYNIDGEAVREMQVDKTEGLGTVSDEFEITAVLVWNPSMRATVEAALGLKLDDINIDLSQGFSPFRSFLAQLFGQNRIDNPDTYAKIYTTISRFAVSAAVMNLNVSVEGNYSEWSESYRVTISPDGLGVSVSGVDLNDSVVF